MSCALPTVLPHVSLGEAAQLFLPCKQNPSKQACFALAVARQRSQNLPIGLVAAILPVYGPHNVKGPKCGPGRSRKDAQSACNSHFNHADWSTIATLNWLTTLFAPHFEFRP